MCRRGCGGRRQPCVLDRPRAGTRFLDLPAPANAGPLSAIPMRTAARHTRGVAVTAPSYAFRMCHRPRFCARMAPGWFRKSPGRHQRHDTVVDAQGVHAFDGAWKSRWTWEGAAVRASGAHRRIVRGPLPHHARQSRGRGVPLGPRRGRWQGCRATLGSCFAPAQTVAGALVRHRLWQWGRCATGSGVSRPE